MSPKIFVREKSSLQEDIHSREVPLDLIHPTRDVVLNDRLKYFFDSSADWCLQHWCLHGGWELNIASL